MMATCSKKEKLKSKKLIERLFAEGYSVSVFSLRLVYMETVFDDDSKYKTGVSVSKRSFKNAVDRNRIKRLLREVYRLKKVDYFNNITTPYAFMILYIGKEKPSFEIVSTKMKQLFGAFLDKVTKN